MKTAVLLLNRGRGSGEVARQHARRLLLKGHQVYYIHPQNKESVNGAFNIDVQLHSDKTPVHEYLPAAGSNQKPVSRMSYEEAIAYLPDYEKELAPIADDLDIIIGHHANIPAIAVHNIAKRYNKPYILFLHGTGIEPRHEGHYDDRIWGLIQKSIEAADGIIVTTEYVRDQLVKPLVDVPFEKFLVLPIGADLHAFHPENTDGITEKYDLPETFVICPGALAPVKGPQNIVAASKQYADLASTIFIGAGEMQEELEGTLENRGRFLGFVPDEDKAKLINAATLLTAAPTKKEHFGIIYVEALAGGTPPVAYAGGGVSTIITPEVGMLTERDPQLLGDAIRTLLENSQRRRDMSIAARARAEEHFSYPNIVSTLEKWLQEIIFAFNG